MSQQEQMSRIDWPPGMERTDDSERERNNRFDTSLSKAFDHLEKQLELLGVDVESDSPDFRYSFDAQQRKRDNRPYARANPGDPGFSVYWKMEGDQFAAACDDYDRLRDNVHEVGLWMKEKRKMQDRRVKTGESEFANARLPPGDDDREKVVARPPADEKDPHEVLGVSPDAPENVVEAAARELKKENHPDNSGSTEEFQKVVEAEEELLQ